MKKYLAVLLIAAVCFLAGVLVGKFVMSRKIVINVVNIKDLVEVIEKYNELKYDFEKIKEWNEQAFAEPVPEENINRKNEK